MKKINLTIIFLLLASFVFAQNDYYWSADKKHYLKLHDNAFVVKMQKELILENPAAARFHRVVNNRNAIK